MNLQRILSNYLERTNPSDALLGAGDPPAGAKAKTKAQLTAEANERLAKDIDAARATASRWRLLTVLALVAAAVGTVLAPRPLNWAGLLGAGGLVATLRSIWRQQLAADLVAALLKAESDPVRRRQLIEAFRGSI